MFEKLTFCINPLPGHRKQHRRSCSMARHLTSLPPLNTLRAPSRIQLVSAAFGRLRERLWNKHNIKLVTKCKVYHAIILSCLLYSSETYTLCRRHIQRLSQIHLRHLRAILGIRWSDRVTNDEALQRADVPSVEAMILSRQLTWTGHVVRMNDDRLPKAVLYGKLWQAKRNVGRLHLRYMDCTKRHFHAANINKRHWEEMAYHRSAWRTAVEKGAAKAETKRTTGAEIKRQRRHERAFALANRTNQQPEFACRYCGRKIAARMDQLSIEKACAGKH